MSCTLYIAIALLLAVGSPATAQGGSVRGEPGQTPASPPPLVNLSGFSEDYQVGPGDLIEVQVIGHEDLHETLRVSNAGEINVSVLGPVRVLEMTSFEIEDEIARQLRAAALVQQPEVLVNVQEYRAKPVHVMGAVTTPGEYVMSQSLTVVDAILLAGGLRFNAADEAILHRRVSADAVWSPAAMAAQPGRATPGIEVVKVDLRPLKAGRFPASTPSLRRGDVVVVPEEVMAAFFVVGDVNEPRNYFFRMEEEITVSEAISMAAGPTPTAKMSQGMLIRYDKQGNRIEKKVDYAAILRGEQPDFDVQPNDIIFIPGSKLKTVAQGMVNITGQAMMSTAFRIGRTYQMPDPPPRPAVPQH